MGRRMRIFVGHVEPLLLRGSKERWLSRVSQSQALNIGASGRRKHQQETAFGGGKEA